MSTETPVYPSLAYFALRGGGTSAHLYNARNGEERRRCALLSQSAPGSTKPPPEEPEPDEPEKK